MPDSLHTVQPHQGVPEQHIERVNIITEQQADADRELLNQAVLATSAENSQKKPDHLPTAQKKPVSIEPQADTVTPAAVAPTPTKENKVGIKMTHPSQEASITKAPSGGTQEGMASWMILGVIVLFLLISFRFRRNFKYLKSLLHETVDSPRRRNLFEDTMRETTFLSLLILLTIVGGGLLLACGLQYMRQGADTLTSGTFPPRILICSGITAGYFLLQWIAYLIMGNTFTARADAARWVQGFKAGVALMGPVLLPLALVGIFYPDVMIYALFIAITVYLLSRILFIFKGFRIFSGRNTYYILFLYYLCSVEIVPIVLLWHLANCLI